MANRAIIAIGFSVTVILLSTNLYITNNSVRAMAEDKVEILKEVETKVRTAETMIYANTVALEGASQRLEGIDNTLLRIEAKMEIAYGLE